MTLGSTVGQSMTTYLKLQLQNGVIVIALYIVGFALAGVPWWPLVGLLAGALNLVPVIGSVLALGLGLLVRSFNIHDWVPLLYVAGVWLVIQIIDGFVLGPRAAGRVGVNPFVSILITLAGGFLFGPIGMLLAVPVVAIVLAVRRARRTPFAEREIEIAPPLDHSVAPPKR